VEAEPVERAHRHEQGEGRVEAARDAEDGACATRMSEPLGEAAALDRENLLATRAAPRRVRRYEGQRGDVAVEGLGPQTLGDLQFDDRRFGRGLLRAEGRRAAPLGFEPFDVHVGYDKLLLRGETFAFAQNGAVLGDQGIACEYQ